MTGQTVMAGQRQVHIDTIAPDAQASTNAYVVLAGSTLDARGWRSLSYTIAVATNAVTWESYGANASDFSDEVIVNAGASVAGGANSSYSVSPPPYAYYRVKIKSTVADTPGTATLRGIQKG